MTSSLNEKTLQAKQAQQSSRRAKADSSESDRENTEDLWVQLFGHK